MITAHIQIHVGGAWQDSGQTVVSERDLVDEVLPAAVGIAGKFLDEGERVRIRINGASGKDFFVGEQPVEWMYRCD